MAILLTGGTGKTSIRMARLLQDAKIPFFLASRKAEAVAPSGMQATKFDWLDPSTFGNLFKHKFLHGDTISAVYLIAPQATDPVPSMTAFIDLAVKQHNVKRFVLLTGSSATKGGNHAGKVWQYLDDIGVEYCVLLATWFMGALLPYTPHLR
jgi:festuclavine dehydrogenase